MTATRKQAEQIKAATGMSLIQINHIAMSYVQAGLCSTRTEALTYMIENL